MPDFSSMSLADKEVRKIFENQIQSLIEKYEPRLKQISVVIEPLSKDYDRSLYMEISAVLLTGHKPLALLFNFQVQCMDKEIHLKGIHYE